MALSFLPLSASKIYPVTPYSRRFELSTADSTAPKDFALTHVLFWPQIEETSKEEVYSNLRQGLGRTVQEVPALCGTVETSPDKELFIEIGEDAHILFEFEDFSANEALESYSDLKEGNFAVSEVHSHLMPAVFKEPVREGSPMTGTKLSIIKGGYALAFGVNHILVDGTSASEIESIWAHHTADVSQGKPFTPHLPVDSKRDAQIRQRLSIPCSGAPKLPDDHPLWEIAPSEHSITRLRPTNQSPVVPSEELGESNVDAHKTPIQNDEKKWYLWRIGPSDLEALKLDATGRSSERQISTSNAIIGLYWARLAAAQKHSGRDHQRSTALMPISMRPRFDPPIPVDFVGNAVSIAMAECRCADLEAEDDLSALRIAAGSLRAAVQSWSVDEFDSYLQTVRSLSPDQGMGIRAKMVLDDHRLVFNDCSRFKCNTNDWGRGLGLPAPCRFPMPAGLVFGATSVVIHPRLPDGSLEVVTALTEADAKALGNDRGFTRYGPRLLCILPTRKKMHI